MGTATAAGVEHALATAAIPAPRASYRDGSGLARTVALLARLGIPQDAVPVVHVAGTAGKGSTVAYLSALLQAHGFRVGTFLSPHVNSVLERFQFDGTPASADRTLAAVDRVVSEAAVVGDATFFELATVTAFQLFADESVDYAIVETGLGGRYDATNAVGRTDKLAVITELGLDHTTILGTTLPEIAAHKSGILPRGGRAIALRTGSPAADKVIAAEAISRGCELRWVNQDCAASSLPTAPLALPGAHQARNAALAVTATEVLARRDGWSPAGTAIRDGLGSAQLPGRFEQRRWHERPVVLDGAHNPLKLAALAHTVREHFPPGRSVWILAMRDTKDVEASMNAIAVGADAVVVTECTRDHHAGGPLNAARLATAAANAGIATVIQTADPRAALDAATALGRPGGPIIATGSFSLVSQLGHVLDDAGTR